MPVLFGLAPGGACPAIDIAGDAVRSYRTFSPLPSAREGGLFSAALSLRPKGPAGRYPAPCFSWSPDFPRLKSRDCPTA